MAAWGDEPAIGILGNPALPRLSIVSFTVRHDGRYLHHNFVVALLNDLFGIQSRGGCSCAGPYGHRLLGIDIETSHAFEREISRGCEGIKPGWIRVNFNYFISEAVFDFLVRAVALVARDGLAARCRGTGSSRRPGCGGTRPGSPEPPLSLHDIRYDADGLHYPAHRHREPESRLADYLDEAERILADPVGGARARRPSPSRSTVGTDFESLRWFWLPEEIAAGRDRGSGRLSSGGRAGARGRRSRCRRPPSPPSCPAWTGSETTRSTCSVIEPTMLSAMIGMPTARSSSAATLMSPPMIEPARTSSRARGRSATARTAAAMFASPTSGIVSTLIRSPRRLWRSASLTAPSATWATCAPPPTTMIRLPKTRAERAGQVDRADVLERLERRRPARPR